MPDQVPPDVVAERYRRLVAVVERTAWEQAKPLVGTTVEVLIVEGEGRKDTATARRSGRAHDNRLVHVADCDARPGDVVTAVVSYAAPHHLVADEVIDIRRTRGGDAWAARQADPDAASVPLGMPSLRA
jgi:tRNA-2-methylthio-N6-dimethylallyladenosine synthase